MNSTVVPDWTIDGVLPPVDPMHPTSGDDRSPYPVSIKEFVLRFNSSEHRREILAGFLDYRKALHDAGLVQGFQWVNGSFVEDIEKLESRAPNDIDVVTFFYLPDGETQEGIREQVRQILEQEANDLQYSIDARLVEIDRDDPEALVRKSIYWYGVWSHRRNRDWKGYLRIDLNPVDDESARNILNGSYVEEHDHELG